jgi:hypothetical protein
MTTVPLNGVAPRTIVVTRTEFEKNGVRDNKPWTLYKVFATEMDGTPITEELRTFEVFEVGEVTVSQEAFVKDGALQHYTLKDVNRRRRVRGSSVPADSCAGCAALETRVEALERRLTAFLKAVD